MKKMIALACLGFAVAVSMPVLAGGQQEKMKGCNKVAKEGGLKGDERKAFMSKCLKKDYVLKANGSAESSAVPDESAASSASPQQNRMKTCNTNATSKKLTGEARKTFMSSCLKG